MTTNIKTDNSYYIQKRTITRVLATQFSYLMFFDNSFHNINDIETILSYIEEVRIILDLAIPDIKYLIKIINSLNENFNVINERIESLLQKSWSLERINLIALSIVKTAICELIVSENINRTIIVNEYANIASQVLDNKEVNFVNALLSKI